MEELLEQVQRRAPPPPRSIDDTIPAALEEICLKALSKQPEQRYRTGADMVAELRAQCIRAPHDGPGWCRWPRHWCNGRPGRRRDCASESEISASPATPLDITHFNMYLPEFAALTRDDLPAVADQQFGGPARDV